MSANSSLITDYPNASAMYAAGVIQSIFVAFCLVGDGFLCVAILCKPKLRTIAFFFQLSMIVLDAFYMFLVVVPLTGNYFAQKNTLGQYCEAHNYIRTMADGVAMWHVGFVILNQYVLFSNHEFFAKYSTDKASLMQLMFSWFLPLLVMISGMIGNLGNSEFFSKVVHCVFFSHTSMTLLVFHTIMSLLLPGIFGVFSATMIFLNVKKVHTQIWDGEQLDPNHFRIDEVHHTKVFSAICFRIIIVSILQISIREAQHQNANFLLFLDLTISCLMCTNPIMYMISKEFRIAYMDLLKCRQKDAEQEEVTDSQEDLKGSQVTLSYSQRARSYSTAGIGVF